MSALESFALEANAASAPRVDDALSQGRAEARRVLAQGSKSFALAGLLLGKRARDDAAVLYAWCRIADDRIDELEHGTALPNDVERRLRGLSRRLDDVYSGRANGILDTALRELVSRRQIPRAYFEELLDGFAMDARGESYETLRDLDRYGYRVAGVIGLMMGHVLGVRDSRCLHAAAHLGMAMQLTNIARDVTEDAARGRQYLPQQLVRASDIRGATGVAQKTVASAVETVLRRAEMYYRLGLQGIRDLDGRSALAIGAAARIYRGIGRVISRRGYAVTPRAVVSLPRKLLYVLLSALALLTQLPSRVTARHAPLHLPDRIVRFDDVQI